MPRFRYEAFCELIYDQDLSYEDLLARETELLAAVQALLQGHDAAHIDFNPTGDSLYVQCLFAAMDAPALAVLCRELATVCGNDVDGRVTLLDRQGDTICIGFTAQEQSRLLSLRLPPPREGVEGHSPLCKPLG